eukprot:TRINITY_DN6629_c0_g2_i1.p1 TRINITY_DN6629_c0_g2~~TRINITY_DN6629_c0_g2_i1.p1  ORF type:complete len:354 (+),score=125.81 TRINITY_DN6629_c0_g2_i1:101-1162(+)
MSKQFFGKQQSEDVAKAIRAKQNRLDEVQGALESMPGASRGPLLQLVENLTNEIKEMEVQLPDRVELKAAQDKLRFALTQNRELEKTQKRELELLDAQLAPLRAQNDELASQLASKERVTQSQAAQIRQLTAERDAAQEFETRWNDAQAECRALAAGTEAAQTEHAHEVAALKQQSEQMVAELRARAEAEGAMVRERFETLRTGIEGELASQAVELGLRQLEDRMRQLEQMLREAEGRVVGLSPLEGQLEALQSERALLREMLTGKDAAGPYSQLDPESWAPLMQLLTRCEELQARATELDEAHQLEVSKRELLAETNMLLQEQAAELGREIVRSRLKTKLLRGANRSQSVSR